MKIQLIRNACLKIEYNGKTILVDPMLGAKGAYDPFAGGPRNPTVDLPMTPEEVVADTDLLMITHTHPDHLDPAAVQLLDKTIPLFYQPFDRERIENYGFEQAEVVEEKLEWEGISIHRTGGKHGQGEILKMMGEVSGFVLQAEGEPTLYIVGDSILEENVEEALATFSPDVVVTNSGGAQFPGSGFILMEETETLAVAELVPKASLVALHLESLDHCTVSRSSLRAAAEAKGITEDRLRIPQDGEVLQF